MRSSVILSVLFFFACAPVHELYVDEDSPKSLDDEKRIKLLLASPDSIVYNDVAELVLNKSCTKCHSEQGKRIADVDVDSYEAVRGQGSKVVVVPFETSRSTMYTTLLIAKHQSLHMPPQKEPQLNEYEISLVYQWILNGAKKEINDVIKRPKTLVETLEPFFIEPQTIDYPLINKYVFSKSCNNCHSVNGYNLKHKNEAMRYGPNTTSYLDLFKNFGIVPGKLLDKYISDEDGNKKKVRGSRIFNSVAVKQTMPFEEEGYQPLDSLRIKLLRLWIVNCAIEDFTAISDDNLNEAVDQDGKIRNCE